jgi:hypothetical protein
MVGICAYIYYCGAHYNNYITAVTVTLTQLWLDLTHTHTTHTHTIICYYTSALKPQFVVNFHSHRQR